MSFAASRARMLASKGRPLTIARGTASPVPFTGFARAYQVGELTGGLQAGDMRVECGPLPPPFTPPMKGDLVTMDGRRWMLKGGGAPVHEGATLIGYSLTVQGT